MPSKEAIIDNVDQYSPSDLAGYIDTGVVTFDELCEEPYFSKPAREEVKALLRKFDERDFKEARDRNTIEAYDAYLAKHQDGQFRSDAREAKHRLQDVSPVVTGTPVSVPEVPVAPSRSGYKASGIKRLKKELESEGNASVHIDIIRSFIEDGSVTMNELYDEIAGNHNMFSSKLIDELDRKRILDFASLEQRSGVNPRFLEYIENNDVNAAVIDVPAAPINAVGAGTTEVYFWGIPSSGKTCALGAIMCEARHGGYVEFAQPVNNCQGYYYMTLLSQIFEGGNEVFKLPEGTQTDAIFEMGYIFKRQKMDFPVTFIDLAGETIESMFLMNAGQEISDRKRIALDTARRLLKGHSGVNRKMHFFVLEYNGHDKKYKGYTQDTLLTGALTYIQDTNIFKTETDGIYLLVTKSDLTGAKSENERNQILKEYIQKHYKQFYNGLVSICETNEINEGYVDIIPFSIGDVCFQNLCLFDNKTAKVVVELIMNRAKGFKTGKMAKIFNVFKK